MNGLHILFHSFDLFFDSNAAALVAICVALGFCTDPVDVAAGCHSFVEWSLDLVDDNTMSHLAYIHNGWVCHRRLDNPGNISKKTARRSFLTTKPAPYHVVYLR